MLPSSSDLRYFLEVSRTHNISRAAERLGISQPSLSLAVQRLEDALGTPLLLRGKSGVQLTKSGDRFQAQARHLLEEWERIRSEVNRREDEIAGSYSLGCHPSVALSTLPLVLPSLLRRHPGLEIKVLHDHSRKITEDVISFKVDFGLVVNPVEHPDLVVRVLYKDEVSLWVGPGKGDALTEPGSGHSVLICDPELSQTQSLLRQFKGGRFERTVTTPNLEVVAALTAAGAGVGILPARVATRLKALGLKPFSKDAPKHADRICLVYRADLQKSEAGRKMGRFIEEQLSASN